MRLVRIEDGLRAGHVGHVIAADGSGTGTILHWSHLLDSLLVLAASPLEPLLGWHRALFVAAAFCGPVSVWLLGVALAWAVAPLAGRRWLWAAPLLAGLSPPVAVYGAFGVAHHHVLLAAGIAAVAGAAGRAAMGDAAAGLRAGVLAAACIWLTPETMPPVLLAFALPLIALVRAPDDAARAAILRAIRRCGFACAVVMTLACLADPPAEAWAAETDRISIVYVALGWAVAAAALALGLRARLLALECAALPLALWAAAFPAVLRGPAGLLDPATAHAFFDDIAEMQPVHGIGEAALFLLPGAAATVLALYLGWRRRAPFWLYAALCGAVAVALAAWHVRFAVFPACLAAGLAPLLLAWASATPRPALRPVLRIALLATDLLLPVLPAYAGALPLRRSPTCDVRAALPLLADLSGETVLTPVNAVPELLYRTRIKTVGSLYHRNAAAYLRLKAAWESDAGAGVPSEVTATGARYVLSCRDPAAPDTVGDSLAAWLDRNDPPSWLVARATAAEGRVALYEVTPGPGPGPAPSSPATAR